MSLEDNFLTDEKFNFIAAHDKAFIYAFDDEMVRLGYNFGNNIGSGFCWGKYMIIYTKTGVKSKKVYARIYLRDSSIVLRLFLSDIDKHRDYVQNAPAYIKEVFTGDFGNCKHCHNEKDGVCMFRKTYTLDDRFIEKCNGSTFEFHEPSLKKLGGYVSLFTKFYPAKNRKIRERI